MFSQDDYQWMSRALELARRGRYTTAPNPCVGAVLVKAGVVVGEGWHQRAGEPHAEVYALHAAGEEARGATAYVTLEPCSHHGRTPPCAEALIKAGVTRVVAAMVDPNPQVGGRGLARGGQGRELEPDARGRVGHLAQHLVELVVQLQQFSALGLDPVHQVDLFLTQLAVSLDFVVLVFHELVLDLLHAIAISRNAL